MSILRYNTSQATGDADSVAAGDQVNGTSLFMGQNFRKVADLSALCVVDAETNTLTLAAKWQGSNDGSTWVDLANAPGNPAAVVLATGTAGADAAVTKAVEAPKAAYGFKFARCSIVVGVTTGTSSDTYTIGYCYRQLSGAEVAD